eukprot:426809-Pleurochrysis_carterae.AAC.1
MADTAATRDETDLRVRSALQHLVHPTRYAARPRSTPQFPRATRRQLAQGTMDDLRMVFPTTSADLLRAALEVAEGDANAATIFLLSSGAADLEHSMRAAQSAAEGESAGGGEGDDEALGEIFAEGNDDEADDQVRIVQLMASSLCQQWKRPLTSHSTETAPGGKISAQ